MVQAFTLMVFDLRFPVFLTGAHISQRSAVRLEVS
jgi:hypothetical protein